MSDSYQAIYNAARQQIGHVDADRALREAFDISFQKEHLQQEIYAVSHEMQRPSVIYRPSIYIDGNQWCALYGENLQDGVAGFGDSPADAMYAFDQAWNEKLAPRRAARTE